TRLLMLILVIVFVSGCSSTKNLGEVDNASENNQEKFKFKVSFVAAETHSAYVALQQNMDKLKEMSDGRIEIEVFPNGVLYGNEREAVEAVQLGNVDITISTTATLSGFSPKFQVFDLPFLFETPEEAYTALDGELG